MRSLIGSRACGREGVFVPQVCCNNDHRLRGFKQQERVVSRSGS